MQNKVRRADISTSHVAARRGLLWSLTALAAFAMGFIAGEQASERAEAPAPPKFAAHEVH